MSFRADKLGVSGLTHAPKDTHTHTQTRAAKIPEELASGKKKDAFINALQHFKTVAKSADQCHFPSICLLYKSMAILCISRDNGQWLIWNIWVSCISNYSRICGCLAPNLPCPFLKSTRASLCKHYLCFISDLWRNVGFTCSVVTGFIH